MTPNRHKPKQTSSVLTPCEEDVLAMRPQKRGEDEKAPAAAAERRKIVREKTDTFISALPQQDSQQLALRM